MMLAPALLTLAAAAAAVAASKPCYWYDGFDDRGVGNTECSSGAESTRDVLSIHGIFNGEST